MGKATRRKQEEADAREQALMGRLYGRQEKHPDYFSPTLFLTQIGSFKDRAIRALDGWMYRGKSSNHDKQKIALIRHIFAKYKVPRFLEEAFVTDALRSEFGEWYMAVAQGQSLYKTCTKGVLTKQETHYLLLAPENLTIKEAIWWAKTMAIQQDIGIAYRLARSPVALRGDFKAEFWIDVHRFFTNNPVPLKEMSELIDYMIAARQESPHWTVKKRTLESIRRASEKWHRDMAKLKQIGGGAWSGMNVDPWTYKTGKFNINPQKDNEIEWTVVEIRTGNELAQEGNQMRHCVFGYKSRCIQGAVSIFSMTSKTALVKHRNLTIEVQISNRTIVQARGLANRVARPQEIEVLTKWAKAHDIKVGSNIYNHW